MAFVSIEDIESNIDVVVFPKLFKDKHTLLEEDCIIVVKGKCSVSDEKYSIIADDIYNIDDGINRLTKNVAIHIDINAELIIIDKLKQLFIANRGDVPITFIVKKPGNYLVHLTVDSKYYVKPSIQFFDKLSQLLGETNFLVAAEK